MARIRYVSDYRIRYRHRKNYRQKNVEMRITIDQTEEPYDFMTESDLERMTDRIWTIFVTETNFTQFDSHAPEAISGTFETTEKTKYEDDRFHVRLDYADYGTDMTSVVIKKAFDRAFDVEEANRLWREERREFWNRIRYHIRDIVQSELTGKPGRKPK